MTHPILSRDIISNYGKVGTGLQYDHLVTWDNPDEHPQKGATINYPEGAPDLTQYVKEVWLMETNFIPYIPEAYRFKTISEFKIANSLKK